MTMLVSHVSSVDSVKLGRIDKKVVAILASVGITARPTWSYSEIDGVVGIELKHFCWTTALFAMFADEFRMTPDDEIIERIRVAIS